MNQGHQCIKNLEADTFQWSMQDLGQSSPGADVYVLLRWAFMERIKSSDSD